MTDREFVSKTMQLIDDLKSVCANYGLGNDASEFNIITQVFLFKYLNDKFIYEAKKANPKPPKTKEKVKICKKIIIARSILTLIRAFSLRALL